MRVVAVPNLEFPPDEESLSLADLALTSLDELTEQVVERLGA